MLRNMFSLLVLIFLVAQACQAQETRRTTIRRDTVIEARPQPIGIGLKLGLHKFGGDIQDGNTFPGAETPWTFGGNLLGYIRLGRVGDNFSVVSLIPRLGYHPLKGMYKEGTPDEFSFTDNVFQFSLGLQMELFPKYDLRPSLQFGVGYLNFKPKITTGAAQLVAHRDQIKGEGTNSGTFYGMGGITWTISRDFDLTFTSEKSLTFTDNLDHYESNIKDNWGSLNLGLMFFFGSATEEKKVEEVVKPVIVDTDGDGLTDADEVAIYKTDPRNKDTDGDGLIDGDEVKVYKTDPTNKDTDGDRLIDGDEVMKYKTNPLKKDTDGDGCIDGDEVLDMKTDALKTDTDGDGCSDCDEVRIYKTKPLVADTDGDGVNDCDEIKNGTDPLKADVLKITDSGNIVLEGITFETNKAIIRPESEQTLIKALNTMKAYPTLIVEIQGHTDDVGKDAANQKLSERRAEAVVKWLVDRGVDAARMTGKGFGEKQPRVPNTSAENRSINRRIEFKIVKR